MVREKHTLHIHIDAPVADVFGYVEDPVHFVAGMAENHHASVVSVDRSPDGVVNGYEIRYRDLGRDQVTRLTREEYVPNERIADHAGAGPIHMLSFEPDGEGTLMTYAWDAPRWMKALDALFVHSDRDVENALSTFKREIEAGV